MTKEYIVRVPQHLLKRFLNITERYGAYNDYNFQKTVIESSQERNGCDIEFRYAYSSNNGMIIDSGWSWVGYYETNYVYGSCKFCSYNYFLNILGSPILEFHMKEFDV